METPPLTSVLYKALAKGIYLALGLYLLLSFIDAIRVIMLFFILAMIFAIALAPPVNWLEGKGVPRVVGMILVLSGVIGTFVGLGFLMAPQISAQINQLSQDLPQYVQSVSDQAIARLGRIPGLDEIAANPQKAVQNVLPSASTVVSRIGSYSVSLLTAVASFIILLSLVAYMLVSPRPLLRGIIGAVPVGMRDPFAAAFSRGSQSVVQWIWANAIIGAIEAVAVTIFLSAMGVPGAFVWGALAFFAELIPQLGGYLMAVPPVLVAFAVNPTTALWVVLFYVVMQQIVNSVIAPPIRSKSMDIHPVSEIFAVLALTLAFGFLGAVIASPLVGFFKAFYDAFYKPKQPDDDRIDDRVEDVLQRRISPGEAPPDEVNELARSAGP
ncbi:MAG: AI-2E family transporter [Fimbriimonas sp.]